MYILPCVLCVFSCLSCACFFQGLLNPLIATEISGAVLKELVRVADRSVLYASSPAVSSVTASPSIAHEKLHTYWYLYMHSGRLISILEPSHLHMSKNTYNSNTHVYMCMHTLNWGIAPCTCTYPVTMVSNCVISLGDKCYITQFESHTVCGITNTYCTVPVCASSVCLLVVLFMYNTTFCVCTCRAKVLVAIDEMNGLYGSTSLQATPKQWVGWPNLSLQCCLCMWVPPI